MNHFISIAAIDADPDHPGVVLLGLSRSWTNKQLQCQPKACTVAAYNRAPPYSRGIKECCDPSVCLSFRLCVCLSDCLSFLRLWLKNGAF